jgi:hypothetical protein
MKKELEISIGIVEINEESYSIQNIDQKIIDTFSTDKLSVEIGFKLDLPGDDLLGVNLLVGYRYNQSDEDVVDLLKASCRYVYKIAELKSLLTIEGKNFKFPSKLMEFLVNISMATMRGYLAAKLGGNFLAKYPLPMFDPVTIGKGLTLGGVDEGPIAKPKSKRVKKQND